MSRLTGVLERAFGRPQGALGRFGGTVMARGNAEQERRAVAEAGIEPGQRVLVIGPGPGVGLQLAAAAVVPGGHVIGVDPSAEMRGMAQARCAAEIIDRVVALRAGGAEDTGCADGSIDVAISVNNVMMWDRPRGFAELHRVLRPGGRLVISVHRHVLSVSAEELREDAINAGFQRAETDLRPRRFSSPAVELNARR